MRIVKNYIFNLVYQVLTLLTPLILTPYICRVLQVEGTGAYSVSNAIVGYFALFGLLGLDVYGNREIAYVRDDEKRIRQSFWEINLIKSCTLGIAIILYLLFVFFTIDVKSKPLYYIETLVLIASVFDISWFFIGIENFQKTTIRNIIIRILSVVTVFLVVRKPEDLPLYALILTGFSVIGQLSMWMVLPKSIRRFDIDKTKLIFHLRRTVKLWLPSIAIQIYASLDKVMLGYLTDDVQAGLYDNSQKIVKIAATIPTSLSAVLMPRMSNLFSNENRTGFSRMAERGMSFVSCLAVPLCAGIIGVRETLVPWFFGPGFEKITVLLLLSAWLVITLSWSNILGNAILLSAGKEKNYMYAVVTGAVVNVAMNLILIPRLKAAGAIVASVAAEYTGMFLMMVMAKQYFSIKRAFSRFPIYIGASGVMCVGCVILGRLVGHTVWGTFSQILVAVAFYLGVLISTKDPNVEYVYGLINDMIDKRKAS